MKARKSALSEWSTFSVRSLPCLSQLIPIRARFRGMLVKKPQIDMHGQTRKVEATMLSMKRSLNLVKNQLEVSEEMELYSKLLKTLWATWAAGINHLFMDLKLLIIFVHLLIENKALHLKAVEIWNRQEDSRFRVSRHNNTVDAKFTSMTQKFAAPIDSLS